MHGLSQSPHRERTTNNFLSTNKPETSFQISTMEEMEDSGEGDGGAGGPAGGGVGYDTSGVTPTDKTTVNVDVLGEKVINDGLLCSILHALSGSPNTDDLVSRIERDIPDVPAILLARKKLFTYYRVVCNDRKKFVLDIDRHTTKNYIKDIVDQLVKVDKVTEIKMFCMPFDYKLEKFETENARVTRVIETAMSLSHEKHFSLGLG